MAQRAKSHGYKFLKYDSYQAQVKLIDSMLGLADKLFYAPFAFLIILSAIFMRNTDLFNIWNLILALFFLTLCLIGFALGLSIRDKALRTLDEIEMEKEKLYKLKKK